MLSVYEVPYEQYEASQISAGIQIQGEGSHLSLYLEGAPPPAGRTVVELCPGLSAVVGIFVGGKRVIASTVAYFGFDS